MADLPASMAELRHFTSSSVLASKPRSRGLHLRGGYDSDPPGYSSDEAPPSYDYTSAESSDSDDPSSSSCCDDDMDGDYEYDDRDHML